MSDDVSSLPAARALPAPRFAWRFTSRLPQPWPTIARTALALLVSGALADLTRGALPLLGSVAPDRGAPHAPAASPVPTVTSGGATQVAMREVDFYVDPAVVLHIHRLRGTMTSRAPGPILFDDKRSFTIHIASAEVGLTGRDLSALLNRYVFAYRGAPLSHLTVTTDGDEIVQRGTLHKGLDIPFEIRAQLDVTPDGLIRMHPTRTRILGVDGDRLMKALGLSLQRLVDLRGARGASVHGNDILLDATRVLPPPAIDGRITGVRVVGDEIVQTFGDAAARDSLPALTPPDTVAPGYMYYRGGMLRFGRMLMLDADMEIVSLDGARPFAFDLDRYQAQLVAGYSRTLATQGLEVHMRDVTRLGRPGPTEVTLR